MTPTRPKADPKGRYTITEAAKLLGVSRQTIYRWMDAGEIHAIVQRKTLRRYITGAELLRVWESDWLPLQTGWKA